jgi:hypothetical protein
MISAEELQQSLKHFTSTDNYYVTVQGGGKKKKNHPQNQAIKLSSF